jgi:glycosyltransferase involved in cell wall biosynthesis
VKPVLVSEVSAVAWSGSQPKRVDPVDVSVVIPTRNRAARVGQAIEKCLALSPPPSEIIIVDDCSDDASAAALRSFEGGIVKYLRLPTNEGQALARSVGFATAKGKYLVSLDDDSWFLEPDALAKICARFDQLPNCGLLALNGFSPLAPVEPAQDRLTLVADHLTCGAAYRSSVLKQTGYHVAFLRYEGEESDLSVKVIDAGFDIVHDASIRFFHDYDPSKRSAATLAAVRRLAVRNDLLRPWIYFPLDIALAVTAWRAGSHLAWGIRHRALWQTLRGYLGFLRFLPRAIEHRRPISRASTRRYLARRRRAEVLNA